MTEETTTVKHWNPKKKITWLKRANIIVFVLIILSLGAFLKSTFTILRFSDVPLSEQIWNNAPGLMLIQNNTTEKPGVEIYRFQDGAPEKIAGNWNFSFSATNQIFLFGSFQNEDNIQRLYVVSDRGSGKRDISALPGPILNISENPKGTYLLISGLSQDNSSSTFYTCVTEKQSPNLQPCDSVLGKILPEYNKESYYQSFWNQKNERELIIQELAGEHKTFAYDPWTDGPTLVTSTEDHKIQKELDNEANHPFFKQLGNIVAFKSIKNEKWKIFTLPRESEIRWADRDHLLALTPNKGVYLIDIIKGKKSHFIDVNNTPENKFSTYYSLEK